MEKEDWENLLDDDAKIVLPKPSYRPLAADVEWEPCTPQQVCPSPPAAPKKSEPTPEPRRPTKNARQQKAEYHLACWLCKHFSQDEVRNHCINLQFPTMEKMMQRKSAPPAAREVFEAIRENEARHGRFKRILREVGGMPYLAKDAAQLEDQFAYKTEVMTMEIREEFIDPVTGQRVKASDKRKGKSSIRAPVLFSVGYDKDQQQTSVSFIKALKA